MDKRINHRIPAEAIKLFDLERIMNRNTEANIEIVMFRIYQINNTGGWLIRHHEIPNSIYEEWYFYSDAQEAFLAFEENFN